MESAFSQCDYTDFQAHFPKNFETYEKFLVDHGIVSWVNTDNAFFTRGGGTSFEDAIHDKKGEFAELSRKLDKNASALQSMQLLRRIKRRIFK